MKAGSVFTRQIRYSDLDVNRHVNNARFTEFLMDCYPAEHHRNHRISSLTVAFVSEAKESDELVMFLVDGSENGGGDFIEVRHSLSGKPVVQASIEWMPAERGW